MSTALSAIGGAIDRATLALHWLGRGVFVITTISAVCYVAGAAHAWWTMPQEWPSNAVVEVRGKDPKTGLTDAPATYVPGQRITDPELLKFLNAPRGSSFDDLVPKRKFEVELPDKRIFAVEAQGVLNARDRAREQLQLAIGKSWSQTEQCFRAALAFFLVGAIFLGLTRVTRWIRGARRRAATRVARS